jgi:hypothetical protein
MDYELAKQLYDAGFPQGGNGNWVYPPDNLVSRHADRVYVPTLEELIRACGRRFFALTHFDSASDSFSAEAYTSKGIPKTKGYTPSEAVAKLWLALHQPKGGV